MSIFHAIILGLVQGLTEFLPVSSSGHLVAFQQIFNIQEASMAFDVILHLGTLVAVFAFFWRDIISIIKEISQWIGELTGFRKKREGPENRGYRVMIIMIIVTSIPTALIGLVFNDFFERMFTSIHIIGYTLLLTGVLLWLSSKISMGTKKAKDIKATDAITIGLFQGIAIMPGISRSGSTIFAAMLMGFNPQLATKFSFLVSIPVILGAALLEARKVLIAGEGFMDILPVIIGFTVAAISGYLAIKLLVDLINRKKLYFFSYYCWGAGIFIILYSLIVH